MNRRGFILPTVLLTLVVLGAFGGAVMLWSYLRWQSSTRTLDALQARVTAESEVDRVIATWDPLLADSMMVGVDAGLPASTMVRGLQATDSLLRLGRGLYLAHAIGRRTAADGALLARSGIAELIRLRSPSFPDSVAVVAAGPVDVTDAGLVDGDDHVPAGWTGWCPGPAGTGTGVMAAPGLPIRSRCTTGACIAGTPVIGVDTAISGTQISQRGVVSLTDLLLGADHRVSGVIMSLGPRLTGGRCSITDSLNWGDPGAPSAPCGGFFPVIAAAPGTAITAGHGQGLLLGIGALELAGTADFSGIILAAGPLVLRDQARVTGLVMAQDTLQVLGSAVLERSRCATHRVGNGSARPGKEVSRGWIRWD